MRHVLLIFSTILLFLNSPLKGQILRGEIQPNVKIQIHKFFSSAVDEPVQAVGEAEIRGGVFKMKFNIGNLIDQTVKVTYKGMVNGIHVFIAQDSEGPYEIRLQSSSKFSGCDVIIYFIGEDDIYVAGKTIESFYP